MAKARAKAAVAKKAAAELQNIGDFLRDATMRFKRARLAYGQGTGNARDEAAFLILETLGLPIDRLDPVLDRRLMPAERRKVAKVIAARIATRQPASYLVKRAYIQGQPFYVDRRTIVPRSFIGELLQSGAVVGNPMSLIAERNAIGRVLDLCTGSGCLAILAARQFPKARVDAVDVSRAALAVARRNVAASPDAARLALFSGDLFGPLKGRRYDLIITNPPYVDAQAMARLPAEYRHEPALALAGGADGLDLVRRILAAAPDHLKPGGGLLCEIGTGRRRLERDYPGYDFQWLDTEQSSGEVFWIGAGALKRASRR